MNIRYRNKLSWLFRRPWLGVPFIGMWVAVSVLYYWWLISRINVLESQNIEYRTQLRFDTKYYQPVIPHAVDTLCETIHLSFVCMGKCTSKITPTLKSLLHHRQNPLHFHMIVDGPSQRTISKLFETWDLPDVNFTCYNVQNNLSKVRWIPNSHYSGVFAMVKLILPEILPVSLKKVILLDSDLTILCDIAELWNLFNNMSNVQLIGLVENESNWYYDQKANRWPALGRGYNTGVILFDLSKMRRNLNWSALWHETVINNIVTLKQTSLADQDVINALIKSNPDIVYNISCQYNVQMSTKSLAKECYGDDSSKVKIIHWNSPSKYDIRIDDADYFRSIHQSYVNYDGNLLREKLYSCNNKPVTYKLNYSDLCVTFRAAQRAKFRTHLYYMDYSYEDKDNFDVTLVVQLSMDRLQFLERLVNMWEGPLSAAIYLSDCEVTKFKNYVKEWSETLSSRQNVGYHLVFKRDSLHYPVNYLRNVALENVNTPYVFLMDVDFVPMAGLYDHLRNAIKLINPYPQKKCLVVAAFEWLQYRSGVPRVKAGVKARLLTPFRAREWPRGHAATDYARWRNATQPYEVEWQSDYEPYLVVHRSVPKYDTRFSGFGWNKVSHSVELRARGFACVVLPDAFVVHTPHAPSTDISAFRTDPHYRVCLAILKQEFMDDLKRKYNVTFAQPSKSEDLSISKKINSN